MTFAGFPRDTFEFLAELRANNDRRWFAANRDRYDRFFVAPAAESGFVQAARLSPKRPIMRANVTSGCSRPRAP